MAGPDNTIVQASLSKTFTSIVDYWLAYANTDLKIIHNIVHSSARSSIMALHGSWAPSFLRCMTPPSPLILQVSHFYPGDFHS